MKKYYKVVNTNGNCLKFWKKWIFFNKWQNNKIGIELINLGYIIKVKYGSRKQYEAHILQSFIKGVYISVKILI